jgi:hypothetical protein
MPRAKDLTGMKFGFLTALRSTEFREPTNGCIIWECKCNCGNIHYANSNSLQTGNITSCGGNSKKGRGPWTRSKLKF